MPTAGICLDCNALYSPPTDGSRALGRCQRCRTNYIRNRPRGNHRPTPARQLAQRFYTSTAWRKARDATRARDGVCTQCGATTNLTVHHIQPISQAPELALNLDNLVTLCRSCHGRHENAQRRR